MQAAWRASEASAAQERLVREQAEKTALGGQMAIVRKEVDEQYLDLQVRAKDVQSYTAGASSGPCAMERQERDRTQHELTTKEEKYRREIDDATGYIRYVVLSEKPGESKQAPEASAEENYAKHGLNLQIRTMGSLSTPGPG
eukprot:SAG11_NODE_13441_length_655_cov_0.652878_2_plen_141_part_01